MASSYDMSQDYFRFLLGDGVEPTNNHSEQQIRHVVIDRRITQGTRSEGGRDWCQRIWTIIATCGQQSRSLFAYLCEAVAAHFDSSPALSLIAIQDSS